MKATTMIINLPSSSLLELAGCVTEEAMSCSGSAVCSVL
jgi:hypothetical protein